jgi:hypothetical protein
MDTGFRRYENNPGIFDMLGQSLQSIALIVFGQVKNLSYRW